jgi:hypothetical protein
MLPCCLLVFVVIDFFAVRRPQSRSFFTFLSIGNQLYILGGMSGTPTEVFDPTSYVLTDLDECTDPAFSNYACAAQSTCSNNPGPFLSFRFPRLNPLIPFVSPL